MATAGLKIASSIIMQSGAARTVQKAFDAFADLKPTSLGTNQEVLEAVGPQFYQVGAQAGSVRNTTDYSMVEVRFGMEGDPIMLLGQARVLGGRVRVTRGRVREPRGRGPRSAASARG